MRFPRGTPLSLEVKKIFKALLVTLFLFLVGSSVMFLFSRSDAAQKGHQLHSVELQNSKLRSQFQEMNQKVLHASSTQAILKSSTVKKMEDIKSPLYLKD